jgi:translation initiation factor 3 subunit E
MTAPQPTEDASAYDLTGLISPHLDLHMMFPLLEYIDSLISANAISYSSSDVAQARLSLLKPTHMVDYAMDIYREVHGEDAEIPREMEEQKNAVFKELEELREGAAKMDELFRNEELRVSADFIVSTCLCIRWMCCVSSYSFPLAANQHQANLVQNNNWNIKFITSEPGFEITPEAISTYYKFAKFNFDCGDYQQGRDMLENYISLFSSPPKLPKEGEEDDEEEGKPVEDEKTGNPNMYYLTSIDTTLLQVLWGKLSCEILVEDWEEAAVALNAVKTAIESLASSNKLSSLEALHQRTWLLHWSLFVFWNDSGKGLESMVELFTSEKYLQAVTTHAPHLLRYLTAAVLLCKRRAAKKAGTNSNAEGRKLLRDLVKVMQQCEYSDPIVEFVDKLSVQFDFDAAQSQLEKCETVLKSDFFLCKQSELFMEEARVFVFENYCRIHHKIDLKNLGDKLAMDSDRAERWIVDLIRNAMLDAKIDSEEGCVVMGAGTVSVYEQVMDKTRDLTARSAGLTANLRGYLNDVRRAKNAREKKAREAMEY